MSLHISPHTMAPPADFEQRRPRPWTTGEERKLREVYPSGGLEACLAAFPDRTPSSLYRRAYDLRLTASTVAERGKRRRSTFVWTAQQDDAIRRAYAEGWGAVKRLCAHLNRPHGSVRLRAIKIGIAVPRQRPLPWSAEEDAVLRAKSYLSMRRLQEAMRLAGYRRTLPALAWRLAELGISRAERTAAAQDHGWFTATQFGDLLGVGSKTVSVWIEKGLITAKRRDKRTWAIRTKAVREFVLTHPAHIDLRKVEAGGNKYLFLDIIGRVGEQHS